MSTNWIAMPRSAPKAPLWQPKASKPASKFAQPAHDEEAYYNPRGSRDPWEGMGYFWAMLAAGVAGWVAWGWWAGLITG